MLKTFLVAMVGAVGFAGSLEAQVINPQRGDVTAMMYRLAFSESPRNPVAAALRSATSPEGQQLRRSIASLWDIPGWVVDLETIQFDAWANTIENTFDQGETHAGVIHAPGGYSICTVEHSSPEVSPGSTLNLRVVRDSCNNGIGWYIVVPHPGAGGRGEDAGINLRISFVRANSEIWAKYSRQCLESNWMVVECGGSSCNPERIWTDAPSSCR